MSIRGLKEKLRYWAYRHAHGKHAKSFLFLVSFAEASFFPVPPDILLIAILLVGAERWIHYAIVTTIGSVLGALFGYLLGFLFFDLFGEFIINFYNLSDAFEKVRVLYMDNAFLAVFISAFTIIPFKVFTVSAGLFKINLLIFILSALLGRGARYFIIAFFIRLYGARIGNLIYKYFNILSLAAVIIVLIILFAFV